ncbi:uncharacterized protein LOC118800480 [Colossoma macropomum]|uniref:uncharacterized protein LOC118800480 n=1 Tax=Colossoma macropomum TaxID=42526 RepID=UPI001864BA91|nr:uncharacterized protein LOC118800480 [Colossoma macropomum]
MIINRIDFPAETPAEREREREREREKERERARERERSVMQSCSSALCILILLISTFTTVLLSAVPPVEVNLHDSATLPCSERCSGLVRWTVFTKPTDTLAECDQTSCRSVKEGYQMIHDQYLKGNLSLTITDADFSKRNMYTCTCDNMAVCDVSLRLQAPVYSKEVQPRESLILDLPISEPVRVTFTRTGDAIQNPVKLCEVEGCKVQCDLPYEERVLFQSSLQLKDLKYSDGGVYTIVDTGNEETVSTYSVSIVGGEKESWIWSFWETAKLYIGFVVGLVVGVLLGFFVLPPLIHCCCCWKKVKKSGDNKDTAEETSSTPPENITLTEVSPG